MVLTFVNMKLIIQDTQIRTELPYIINKAEKSGLIDKNSTIIETSSGNTGFSLSMIAMVKGYKMYCCSFIKIIN